MATRLNRLRWDVQWMDGVHLTRHLFPNQNTVNEEVSDTRKLLDASTKKYAPPPGAHLYLVCFHLPVTISKVRACLYVCCDGHSK